MRVNDLFYWIIERYAIFKKKESGEPKPWTEDLILQTYKFCNVHRENDKVTKWIATNWRKPFAKSHEEIMWFWMTVARLFNWPETLNHIGFGGEFNPAFMNKCLHSYKSTGKKVFGAAYIVSTNGRSMDKIDYVVGHVLEPMWKDRTRVTDTYMSCYGLQDFHTELSRFNGMGSFMAAQVVADLKYIDPLKKAHDWEDFAASGPGSRRGLNRVLGLEVKRSMPEKYWKKNLVELLSPINCLCDANGIPPLHAQDLQNCLCEFDKYERTRLGQGTPKALYPGRR